MSDPVISQWCAVSVVDPSRDHGGQSYRNKTNSLLLCDYFQNLRVFPFPQCSTSPSVLKGNKQAEKRKWGREWNYGGVTKTKLEKAMWKSTTVEVF